MAESKQTPSFSEIASKASKKALSGGIAGAAAQSINVCTLMWMRTIMNCQYRYGGTFKDTVTKLYAEGGVPRFYRGLAPALVQAPMSRFGDTAANDGALAALEHTTIPMPVKSAAASGIAAVMRVFLMPIDAWKTTKQVEGEEGLRKLMEKTKKNWTAPWQGAIATMSATWVGHYPWFATNNLLDEKAPEFNFYLGKHLRRALIGFASAAVSDTCSNSLRVLKTRVQTSLVPISYRDAVKEITEKEGWAGLFGRGLKTRIITNGVQGALFTIGWKAISEALQKRGL